MQIVLLIFQQNILLLSELYITISTTYCNGCVESLSLSVKVVADDQISKKFIYQGNRYIWHPEDGLYSATYVTN